MDINAIKQLDNEQIYLDFHIVDELGHPSAMNKSKYSCLGIYSSNPASNDKKDSGNHNGLSSTLTEFTNTEYNPQFDPSFIYSTVRKPHKKYQQSQQSFTNNPSNEPLKEIDLKHIKKDQIGQCTLPRKHNMIKTIPGQAYSIKPYPNKNSHQFDKNNITFPTLLQKPPLQLNCENSKSCCEFIATYRQGAPFYSSKSYSGLPHNFSTLRNNMPQNCRSIFDYNIENKKTKGTIHPYDRPLPSIPPTCAIPTNKNNYNFNNIFQINSTFNSPQSKQLYKKASQYDIYNTGTPKQVVKNYYYNQSCGPHLFNSTIDEHTYHIQNSPYKKTQKMTYNYAQKRPRNEQIEFSSDGKDKGTKKKGHLRSNSEHFIPKMEHNFSNRQIYTDNSLSCSGRLNFERKDNYQQSTRLGHCRNDLTKQQQRVKNSMDQLERSSLSDSNYSSTTGPCCRICDSPADYHNKLIRPCRCSGTLAFVHEHCLNKWFETTNNQDMPRCEVCLYRIRTYIRYNPLRISCPLVTSCDVILHSVFFACIIIIVGCVAMNVAAYTNNRIPYFKPPPLDFDEWLTIISFVFFWLAISVALMTQAKSKVSLLRLLYRTILSALDHHIEEYRGSCDSMNKLPL